MMEMNFSTVYGNNTYTQHTAKAAETAGLQETLKERGNTVAGLGESADITEGFDTVTISHTARTNSQTPVQKPSFITQRESAQTTLKEWMKDSNFPGTRKINQAPVSKLSQAPVNETLNINVETWCASSVTEKNAEKAKVIQSFLNTAPGGISWGLLLQKLPVE